MKVVFLGTNGWYDTALGNTLSVLLETNKYYIVFDAGNGFYKLDKFIKDDKPIYLFLSHFHLDHIIGLHILKKFNFKQGINIFGPAGIKKYVGRLVSFPYSAPLTKLCTKVILREFKNNLEFPFVIEAKRLLHEGTCFGYRVFVDGKSIVFCTDTGKCDNFKILAKNADLLITESSLPAGVADNKWPHLNPETAAQIAKSAGVRKLALVHFDASQYLHIKDRVEAEKASKKIFKNTLVCYDNMKIEL